MHDGSQVPNDGNGGNVAPDGNSSEESIDRRKVVGYFCNRCNRGIKKQGYIAAYTHEQHVRDCWPDGVRGVDYVECAFCKLAARNIKQHIKKNHPEIDLKDYVAQYGPLIASNTRKTYSQRNKFNGDWISRANERGDDLTIYKKKMGKAVSDSILSNPEERKRRSKLAETTIVAWAKSDEGRETASRTAEETSLRPEILEMRTKNLAAWREREPDRFYNECFVKMQQASGISVSRPEKALLEWCQHVYPDFKFKGNQRVKGEKFFLLNKSRKRQIDILSRKRMIMIEFDGYVHFNAPYGQDVLDQTRAKDHELNVGGVALGYTVIRVSEDNWHYGKKVFKPECLDRLHDAILNAKEPKLVLIGGKYER